MSDEAGGNLPLIIKWQGKEYEINSLQLKTVGDLKAKIKERTGVNVDRQKLLNLVFKGKLTNHSQIAEKQN